MSLLSVKERIIASGKELLSTGLVSRSWGNISSRYGTGYFLITPSGRNYLDLTASEIVVANIANEGSWGKIMPSSEVGLHRSLYRIRPEVNFIIHTHQFEATAFSALERAIKGTTSNSAINRIFGGDIPCANYALPGTDELRYNTAKAVLDSCGKAVFLAHHGAVLMASSPEEAFKLALALEDATAREVTEKLRHKSNGKYNNPGMLYDFIANKLTDNSTSIDISDKGFFLSERTPTGFTVTTEAGEYACDYRNSDNELCRILKSIYQNRPDVNFVIRGTGKATNAFSVIGNNLPAYLDDYAQIAGATLKKATFNDVDILEKSADNNGVFIKNGGCLCYGATGEDAFAVSMIIEKNCKAWFLSKLFDTNKPLSANYAQFMRDFYLKDYSKRYQK